MSIVTAPRQPQSTLTSITAGPRPWPPELFEEITDLLAEALFQDFQTHRKATVRSPLGRQHINPLTELENEIK